MTKIIYRNIPQYTVMKSILLATTSTIKLQAVTKIFPPTEYTIVSVNCGSCNLPPQPVNCSERCAMARIDYAKTTMSPQKFDYYIAIENGIEFPMKDSSILDDESRMQYRRDQIEHPPSEVILRDVCSIVIEHNGSQVSSKKGFDFRVPREYYKRLSGYIIYDHYIQGFSTTIGELMHKDDPSIDDKNWVKSYHGVCRSSQIESKLKFVKSKIERMI